MMLLDPLARPVVGHRGNRAYAPENTIPSLLDAVALGVDALEFDLRVSKDGVLVLMHDPTLDRTTDGVGPVASLTSRELRTVDAGARFTRNGSDFPWRGRGAHVPTFDEVIEAIPRTLPLIIELKTPAATGLLIDAIERHDLGRRIIVAGFDREATRPLRGGAIALGASTPDVAGLLLPSLLRWPVSPPGFQALCIPPTYKGMPLPVPALARITRRHGVVTHVWTVNAPAYAQQLWRQGINGMITDDPALILAAREGV